MLLGSWVGTAACVVCTQWMVYEISDEVGYGLDLIQNTNHQYHGLGPFHNFYFTRDCPISCDA